MFYLGIEEREEAPKEEEPVLAPGGFLEERDDCRVAVFLRDGQRREW